MIPAVVWDSMPGAYVAGVFFNQVGDFQNSIEPPSIHMTSDKGKATRLVQKKKNTRLNQKKKKTMQGCDSYSAVHRDYWALIEVEGWCGLDRDAETCGDLHRHGTVCSLHGRALPTIDTGALASH